MPKTADACRSTRSSPRPCWQGLGWPWPRRRSRPPGSRREAPESWVQILRFVRRMADAAVRRDLQGPTFGEESAFPAIKKRIELLEPDKAAQRWLARYRALTAVREKVKNMNDSEQVRTIRWPGDPATVTAEGVDFEAVAHMLGNTCCWGGRSRRFYSLAQHALTVSGAIDRLGGMNEEDRRVLSLHALLADAWRAWVREDPGAQPSGKAAAQARRSEKAAVIRTVLEAARLDIELPGDWADALRFTQRMAEAAVSRDLPEAGTGGERSGPLGGTGPLFPPLKDRTRPLRPDRAATLWLERFGELSEPPQGDTER